MNPFGWIRRKAAEAVALGVADGLAAVSEGEIAPDLAGLRQLAAGSVTPKELPAPETAERQKGGRGKV